MSTHTPNFNLEKPDADEFYDVSVPNANMDIIDNKLKGLDQQLITHSAETIKWAFAYSTMVQSIPSNIVTDLVFNKLQNFNNADIAKIDSNGNIKLKKGVYIVIGQVEFSPNPSGIRRIKINSILQQAPGASNSAEYDYLSTSDITNITSDDTKLTIEVYQNSGATLNTRDAGFVSVKIFKVGDL
ncbi:hypothetical protein ACULLL_16570 [Lysinibacillus irui]|uniref:hypothetical protein n=1 Tax=Lysinibacillus irui TaxID=2998077 RepID=UPI004043DB97